MAPSLYTVIALSKGKVVASGSDEYKVVTGWARDWRKSGVLKTPRGALHFDEVRTFKLPKCPSCGGQIHWIGPPPPPRSRMNAFCTSCPARFRLDMHTGAVAVYQPNRPIRVRRVA